jgi:hypothetical protein
VITTPDEGIHAQSKQSTTQTASWFDARRNSEARASTAIEDDAVIGILVQLKNGPSNKSRNLSCLQNCAQEFPSNARECSRKSNNASSGISVWQADITALEH